MSGWIKLEKDIRSDPRFLRMCKGLRNSDVTQLRLTPELAATLLVGCLAQLWMYADSHIREDDTLDLGPDEIDELVGVQGFTNLMPVDWLEVIDQHCVKLPSFQEHNGTDAKKRALTAKRVERHRIRNVTQERSNHSSSSNVHALPDQTRPDQTKDKKSAPSVPAWFSEFRLAYPPRAGSQRWRDAERAANSRIAEGHVARELIDGAIRYAAYCRTLGKLKTEFVLQAATFLGPNKQFLEPWETPETPASRDADKRAAAEQRALVELKSRAERIGFRQPMDGEDVIGYRTLVERAEANNYRPQRANS